MKRLYENIENIHIKGEIALLVDLVTRMDNYFQDMAMNTDRLAKELMRYSSSNSGKQYEKVIETATELRRELFVASEEMNDLQNQLVRYINKIYVYEDIREYMKRENAYMVNKEMKIFNDSRILKFDKSEMIQVVIALDDYSKNVYEISRKVIDEKNTIGSVWVDRQYDDFSEYVVQIIKKIAMAIQVFDEYKMYLEGKIKELN